MIQIPLFTVLSLIAYQDLKDRMVHWILFPIAAFFMGTLYFTKSGLEQYSLFVIGNLILVITVLSILYMYTKYLRKMEFLDVSFGLGDILFFIAFALGFPTVTFLILFVSSIVFSLLIFLIFNRKGTIENVPLAGFMSIFLIGIYGISFLPKVPSLYYF